MHDSEERFTTFESNALQNLESCTAALTRSQKGTIFHKHQTWAYQTDHDQTHAMDPLVVSILLDHLSVATTFRLWIAHGAPLDECMWPVEETKSWLHHHSKITRAVSDMPTLSACMARSKSRCRECGQKTQRKLLICGRCANERGNYRELWDRCRTRTEMKARSGRYHDAEIAKMKRVKVGSRGEYLYWAKDARALVAKFAHGTPSAISCYAIQ